MSILMQTFGFALATYTLDLLIIPSVFAGTSWSPIETPPSAMNGHYIPVRESEAINLNQVRSRPTAPPELPRPLRQVGQQQQFKVQALEVEDPLDLSNELRLTTKPAEGLHVIRPQTVTNMNRPVIAETVPLTLQNVNYYHTKEPDVPVMHEDGNHLVPPTGARRIDAYVGDDVLVYDDIYPKRVPEKIRKQWDMYEDELQSLREQRKIRRLRRQRLREKVRRRQDRESKLRLRTSRYRRLREQRARSHFGPEDNPSLFRSFLGVSPYCLNEESSQYSCTFTPSCWLVGGVPQPGCDSLIYSCCVLPGASVARKEV